MRCSAEPWGRSATLHTMRRIISLALIVVAALNAYRVAAEPSASPSAIPAVKQSATSKYPVAIEPKKVGTYPALTKSGGGYFYDDVLEYRVWIVPAGGGDDYFKAFATYEEAELFAQKTRGADKPLVLVRQLEHVNEPRKGVFERVVGERLTEWVPAWLEGTKRAEDSIAKFLANPRPMRTNQDK
jgi:hypothetical protein